METSENNEHFDERLQQCRDVLWRRFVDSEHLTIYDWPEYRTRRPPTAEEIRRCIPNVAGWATGMEDCAINGGVCLAAIVEGQAMGFDLEDHIRRIYSGLRLLCTVSDRKGFLARGVRPEDGKSHYVNSSVDQYTHCLDGLWRYHRSAVCTDEHRGQIASIVADMCRCVEQDGFSLLTETGRESIFGDIGAFVPDRACRLLQMYRVGHAVTGEEHWLDVYWDKVNENGRARLADFTGGWDLSGWSVYALFQNQVALRDLYELEDDAEVKEIYRQGLRKAARLIAPVIGQYKDHDPQQMAFECDFDWRGALSDFVADNPGLDLSDPTQHEHLMKFIEKYWMVRRAALLHEGKTARQPLEAAVTVLLSDDEELIRKVSRDMLRLLSVYSYETLHASHSLCVAEYFHYLTVRQGVTGRR